MSQSNLSGSSDGQHHNPIFREASREIPPTDERKNIRDVENEIEGHNQGINTPAEDLEDNKPIDLDQELDAVIQILKNDTLFKCIANESRDLESEVMRQIANNGAEELKKLCTRNEPFWLKDVNEGKFIFQSDKYQRILDRRYCLKGPNARVECSRDSRLVNMNVEQLVDIFLDSGKWSDLFSSIVKKAETLKRLSRDRNGALLLMSAEMQIPSDWVPTPEFIFLRCCREFEDGAWVIGDVSINSSKYKNSSGGGFLWRRPSGCLIRQINQGFCWVCWVEHVEVDEKIENQQDFGDAMTQTNAYGAEKWLSALERMSFRFP